MAQHRLVGALSGWPILTIFGLCLLGVVANTGCGASEEPPRRIIIITIDTLRADHLGTYGYPRQVSPFLDEIATRSVVFERAFSSCSHTGPSHASLFTSLQPAQHRLLVNGEQLDEKVVTLAEALQQSGYATAAFTPVKFLTGVSAGFDHFGASPKYENVHEVLARARAWLDRTGKEKPAFVWIHLFDVHQWNIQRHRHSKSITWVRENARPNGSKLIYWLNENHGLPKIEKKSTRRWMSQQYNRYDGQLLELDGALRTFYDELQHDGFLDDSLWFITSDHGEGLGNHGQMGHGQYIYDEQVRVPLFVHSPAGRYEARMEPTMVRLVDVAPTVAELVGATLEDQPIPIVGRSFAELLKNPRSGWSLSEAFAQRRPADQKRLDEGWIDGQVYATRNPKRSVFINSEAENEFYDLVNDPFELENIFDPDDPEMSEIVRGLTESFEFMGTQGEALQSGVASPEIIEELKALGYL
jgi:arylsulfatase A-like enzyme